LKRESAFSLLVIPGRAKHEPGIHFRLTFQGEMDSGLAAQRKIALLFCRGAPGMTDDMPQQRATSA
jgi:hypothetical protein